MLKKKRIVITPYKLGSSGAKALQQVLKETTNRRVIRVKQTSIKYKKRPSDVNINWGNCSEAPWSIPEQETAKAIARNKLKTFKVFKEHGIPHPEWTTKAQEAILWDKEYFARTLLTSHSGNGIISYMAGETPVQAPLYVQYKKKKNEYRVHVFNGQVIDVQHKKKRAGFEGRNNQIRNNKNGWVYCRENIVEPGDLREVAVAACNVINLLYGAVDIIWNEKENKCYVLEINTAPGLVGTTTNKYSNAFKELFNV